MGGGWFGYVVSIFGCGLVLALIGGSTAALYAWARVQRKGGQERTVRVRSLSRPDGELNSDESDP